MKKLSSKILTVYVIYTLLFFILSFVFKDYNSSENDTLGSGLRNAISEAFYWATMFVYFLLSVIGSSIVGMIFCKMKNNSSGLMTFCLVFLSAIVIGGTMILLG